jgi:hypothetical protein
LVAPPSSPSPERALTAPARAARAPASPHAPELTRVSRRATLTGLLATAATAALSAPGVAWADDAADAAKDAASNRAADGSIKKSRVVKVSNGARGVTIHLELANSPFPAPGSPHRDATVLAFVSHRFRASSDGKVAMVVHFHGLNGDVDHAVEKHQLREQFHDSKQNAILLVPELAAHSQSSAAGKLEVDGGFSRLLHDALATLNLSSARQALGEARLPARPQIGSVCVSAHSGGYHAAASCITHGQVRIQEVYLFDALYAEADVFKKWVIAGKGKSMHERHKLVSYYTGGTTAANTQALFAELTKAGVRTAEEKVEGTLSREQLTLSEAVSIKSGLGHGAVTSDLNSLRDCLFASALPRQLRSAWFKSKSGSRPLEKRAK